MASKEQILQVMSTAVSSTFSDLQGFRFDCVRHDPRVSELHAWTGWFRFRVLECLSKEI